jgi:MATE family multidrug resistance protein
MSKEKVLDIVKLSCPNILALIVQFGIPVITLFFVGRLGPLYLGAIALGNMIVNATGYSIGFGLANALDTFCSQSFGAKQYSMVGLHCQRAMLILSLLCLPIMCVWYFTEPFLNLIGIDQEISSIAGEWAIFQILGLWPEFMAECLKKYLFAQSIVWPQAVTIAITTTEHLLVCWLLVPRYGFLGAAIAAPLALGFSFSALLLMQQSISHVVLEKYLSLL